VLSLAAAFRGSIRLTTCGAHTRAQELITKLQNHVETAREQIMVHLDELLGVLASEKAQIDIAAGLFSTERESQAHAANAQADMQQRQAHTLDDFFKRLKQLKSISCAQATPAVRLRVRTLCTRAVGSAISVYCSLHRSMTAMLK
jgi:hypothetical protein